MVRSLIYRHSCRRNCSSIQMAMSKEAGNKVYHTNVVLYYSKRCIISLKVVYCPEMLYVSVNGLSNHALQRKATSEKVRSTRHSHFRFLCMETLYVLQWICVSTHQCDPYQPNIWPNLQRNLKTVMQNRSQLYWRHLDYLPP